MHYKVAKTFKEFKKIERKYFERSVRRDMKHGTSWRMSPWLEYWATFDEMRTNKSLRDYLGYGQPDKEWMFDYEGCKVIYDGEICTVRGINITNEDFYWWVESDSVFGKSRISAMTCCGPMDTIERGDEFKEYIYEPPMFGEWVMCYTTNREHYLSEKGDITYIEVMLVNKDGSECWEDRSGIIYPPSTFKFWRKL